MLDFAKWSKRAVAFIGALRGFPGKADIQIDVGSPYALDRIRALSAGCPLQIPDALMNWYLSVGSCHCTYFLDIPVAFEQQMKFALPDTKADTLWGGVDLIDLPDAAAMPNDCAEIASVFQEDGFSNDARLWANSFPFMREGSGDFIGLYVEDNTTDAPVVYLSHEGYGASQVISPSFEQFLGDWEGLGYIGCHYFHCFINPRTGLLDTKHREEAVRALQGLFQGIPRADL
jgi:hypothetical protein